MGHDATRRTKKCNPPHSVSVACRTRTLTVAAMARCRLSRGDTLAGAVAGFCAAVAAAAPTCRPCTVCRLPTTTTVSPAAADLADTGCTPPAAAWSAARCVAFIAADMGAAHSCHRPAHTHHASLFNPAAVISHQPLSPPSCIVERTQETTDGANQLMPGRTTVGRGMGSLSHRHARLVRVEDVRELLVDHVLRWLALCTPHAHRTESRTAGTRLRDS
jgi:hypothetical protein